MQAHSLDVIPLHPAPHQGVAKVTRADGRGLWCDDGRTERRAERAASCLLAPEVGDRVWMVTEPGQGCYVLAVLQRAGRGPAPLTVDGDARLAVRGALAIEAEGNMRMTSGGALGMGADEVDIRASRGTMAMEQFSVAVGSLLGTLGSVKLVGRWLESSYERVVQRVKRSYRHVEQTDHLRANEIDHRAEENAHLRAKNALVSARQLVKVDGEQVHLG